MLIYYCVYKEQVIIACRDEGENSQINGCVEKCDYLTLFDCQF